MPPSIAWRPSRRLPWFACLQAVDPGQGEQLELGFACWSSESPLWRRPSVGQIGSADRPGGLSIPAAARRHRRRQSVCWPAACSGSCCDSHPGHSGLREAIEQHDLTLGPGPGAVQNLAGHGPGVRMLNERPCPKV